MIRLYFKKRALLEEVRIGGEFLRECFKDDLNESEGYLRSTLSQMKRDDEDRTELEEKISRVSMIQKQERDNKRSIEDLEVYLAFLKKNLWSNE